MNRLTLAVSVVAIALGGTSLYLWQQLQVERQISERSLRRTLELESHLTLAATEPGEPIDPGRELLGVAKTSDPQSTATPQPSSTSPEEDVQEGTADPGQPRAAKLAGHRRWVYRVFPDLATALDLEDEKAEALTDLLAAQRLDAEENPPFVPEGELHWDANSKPDWVRKMEERQRARDKEIAGLLGEDKFRVWQDFVSSLAARRLLRELRPMLDGTADSLRDDQMTLLINSITEAQRRFVADSAANTWTPAEQFARRNERLREAVVPYLTQPQLRKFDQMLQRQLE
jgi:hypothetical protein